MKKKIARDGETLGVQLHFRLRNRTEMEKCQPVWGVHKEVLGQRNDKWTEKIKEKEQSQREEPRFC